MCISAPIQMFINHIKCLATLTLWEHCKTLFLLLSPVFPFPLCTSSPKVNSTWETLRCKQFNSKIFTQQPFTALIYTQWMMQKKNRRRFFCLLDEPLQQPWITVYKYLTYVIYLSLISMKMSTVITKEFMRVNPPFISLPSLLNLTSKLDWSMPEFNYQQTPDKVSKRCWLKSS